MTVSTWGRVGVVCALVCASCANGPGPATPVRKQGVSDRQLFAAVCAARGPADVLQVQDAPAGANIVMSTDGDNVAELRRRVFDRVGALPARTRQDARASGGGLHQVLLEESPNGVQLRVFANSPAGIPEVRSAVREQLVRMASGDCP